MKKFKKRYIYTLINPVQQFWVSWWGNLPWGDPQILKINSPIGKITIEGNFADLTAYRLILEKIK